jgi:hypothetical protein
MDEENSRFLSRSVTGKKRGTSGPGFVVAGGRDSPVNPSREVCAQAISDLRPVGLRTHLSSVKVLLKDDIKAIGETNQQASRIQALPKTLQFYSAREVAIKFTDDPKRAKSNPKNP